MGCSYQTPRRVTEKKTVAGDVLFAIWPLCRITEPQTILVGGVLCRDPHAGSALPLALRPPRIAASPAHATLPPHAFRVPPPQAEPVRPPSIPYTRFETRISPRIALFVFLLVIPFLNVSFRKWFALPPRLSHPCPPPTCPPPPTLRLRHPSEPSPPRPPLPSPSRTRRANHPSPPSPHVVKFQWL